MNWMLKQFIKALGVARLYSASFYGGFKNRKLFEDIETYCMFIGYPRSGHSLIGSLLDAHPNMIIAHELDVLMYIRAGFSKRQIYHLLLERSRVFAQGRRTRGNYFYDVPNQWQGRYKKLQIIGDKNGNGDIWRLNVVQGLLERLRDTMNINIKFIHVIRNPYDNISTICRKTKIHGRHLDLMDSIGFYFSLCEKVQDIKQQIKCTDLFELRYESFIESPKKYLKELCHFLGADAPDDYLNDCAGIVFQSPHKSRYDTKWNQELIDLVKNRMKKFPFLEGYSFED